MKVTLSKYTVKMWDNEVKWSGYSEPRYFASGIWAANSHDAIREAIREWKADPLNDFAVDHECVFEATEG